MTIRLNDHMIMYTTEFFFKGLKILGIEDIETISDILKSNDENLQYLKECRENEKNLYELQNKFKVPFGLTKKEYSSLQNETQKILDELKKLLQHDPYNFFYLDLQDNYIKKKEKIKIFTQKKKEASELDIAKAKAYPLDSLLEFNREFAHCFLHEDKTPSLKFYKENNKAYCFSCHKSFDAIDVYQKLHNVSFVEAIKNLS